jgi:hypothetical protein
MAIVSHLKIYIIYHKEEVILKDLVIALRISIGCVEKGVRVF